MATPRRPLGEIDGNRRYGSELTPYLRGKIEGAYEGEATPTDISDRYVLPVSTITTTISRASTKVDGESQPRCGRPKVISEREERLILRLIRRFPKKTYDALRRENGIIASVRTIRRFLKTHGIKKWLVKKRPILTKEHVKQRLQWVRVRKDWSEEEWKTIIFSDECSVERGAGKQRDWVFRLSGQ